MNKESLNPEKEININKQIAQLIEAHGFKANCSGDKIIADFKDKVEIETWVYPRQNGNLVQTRFDIGVTFDNGQQLFEAFGDIGVDLDDCIQKNIESFSISSLHVFLDAFNDTNHHVEREKWQIGDVEYHAFIGNYNVKSFAKNTVKIPERLFASLQNSISNYTLTEDYYFIRLFYAHTKKQTLAIEFMLNNNNLENEEERLADLDWMGSEDYYSIRNFIILKRNLENYNGK